MGRVYYFELPVDDMDRAIRFYETVFGWKITKHDRDSGPYFSVETGANTEPGINGSFFKKAEDWTNISNVIGVKDINQAISKLESFGGQIVFPKTTINGVGYLAYFKDLDGNVFGIMQSDPSVHQEGGM